MRLMSDASLGTELLITHYPITCPPPIRTAYKIPERAYNNAIFVYFEETLSRQPFALFGFRVWRLNKFFRRSPVSRRDILCLHYNIFTIFCQAFYTVFWKFLSIKLQFYYTAYFPLKIRKILKQTCWKLSPVFFIQMAAPSSTPMVMVKSIIIKFFRSSICLPLPFWWAYYTTIMKPCQLFLHDFWN